MARELAESIIAKLFRLIISIAKAYAPESDYLTISLCKGQIHFNNDYFESWVEHKLNHFEEL